MKKKKILTYLLSMLIPVLIFLICTYLNGYLPFKEEMLNSYDSFTQYPGILLEYIRGLKTGNIFYSFNAGLGFNLFGTITYYCMSPLNLFAFFATPENYPFFITAMTFLRFALLGFTMCFYLSKKNIKPRFIVLFSTVFVLMGYTSTYYYNFLWIDSIIMLPLVIHGLDKLLSGKSPFFYLTTLTITICISYYIGYMICIFSTLWFICKIIDKKNKKELIIKFLGSSLLSGLCSMIILLPSIFALLTGKASIYGSVDYLGFTPHFESILYTLTAGSYLQSDQILGPAEIYCSTFTLVLVVFYFFNTKIKKRQKIATISIIIFFILSFSLKFLNYGWQLFQKPIWWQSRFSFTFSFLLITIAVDTISKIEFTKFKTKYRIIILILLVALTILGAVCKWHDAKVPIYTYFLFGFSLLIIIESFFLLDKKGFLVMLMIFTLIEVSLNTFNSLKQNYRYKAYIQYDYIKKELPGTLKDLELENDNFYRLEFIDDYTSNDGLYFGFHGVNYFNSVRNINVVKMVKNLGFKVTDNCHFILSEFDPILLSIFNVKYLYGREANYYKEVDKMIFENPYPLAIGFTANDKIKNFGFMSDNPYLNRESLLKTLSNLNLDIYTKIGFDEFDVKKEENDKTIFTYSFKSDGNYLVIPEKLSCRIKINGIEYASGATFMEISKGDSVTVKYTCYGKYEENKIKFNLFDLDNYTKHMNVLNNNLLNAKTNTSGHILEGTIDVTTNHEYLFTSIEYEEGMKVYVDDSEVKPDILMGALIGLPLSKGSHTIKIDYVPKGFKIGLSLSILGILGSSLWFILYQRKDSI